MTDRETMYQGLSHAAWGYFFIHFDFNLGTVSVLPAFAGYLLMLYAIRDLSGARRDLALLRPLTILLAAWSGGSWLLSWAGQSLDGVFLPLDLVVTVASLYFHFQFLTDMAALAAEHQPEDGNLDRRLRNRRTAIVVLTTAVHVVGCLPLGRFQDAQAAVMTGLAVVTLVAVALVMMGLFELRRFFKEESAQPEA